MENNEYTEILIQFGNKLRTLRKEKGLSQEQLAQRAGLDRTYISSIERGRRNVALINCFRLAQALSISIYDFFKDEQERL